MEIKYGYIYYHDKKKDGFQKTDAFSLTVQKNGKLGIEYSNFIDANDDEPAYRFSVYELPKQLAEQLRDFLNENYPKK